MSIREIFSSNGARPTIGRTRGGGLIDPGAIALAQGGGGGGGGGLPFTYLFEEDHSVAGSLSDDWTIATGYSVAHSLIAPPAGISMTPSNAVCLKLPTTASQTAIYNHALPVSVDVSAGFRFSVWFKGSIDQQASINYFFNDRLYEDGNGYNCLQYGENLSATNAGGWYYRNNEVHQGGISNLGSHASMGGWHWHQFRAQYNPITDILNTWIFQSSGGQGRHTSGDLDISSFSSLVACEEITHLALYNAAASAFGGDLFFIGYWFGSLTDDYPPVAGTPSL